jgi:hypothetical protein
MHGQQNIKFVINVGSVTANAPVALGLHTTDVSYLVNFLTSTYRLCQLCEIVRLAPVFFMEAIPMSYELIK